MSVNLFDPNYYRAANPDLAGFSNAQAEAHFNQYGLNEGRAFSPYVDLKFYRASNADLSNFGNADLFEHLEDFGIEEGRSFSPLVDLDYYRVSNTDLSRFSNEQALEHLQTYGLNEGRSFSPFVDVSFYKSTYGDLSSFSNSQALQHLELYGLDEGRSFSPFVDLSFYRQFNADLATFSNEDALSHLETYGLEEGRVFSSIVDLGLYRYANADLKNFSNWGLLSHLETYGVGEGRIFSSPFAVDYYIDDNPDVVTAYATGRSLRTDAVVASDSESGNLRKAAFKHFISFGLNEGRQASDEFDVETYADANEDLQKLSNSDLYRHFRAYGIDEARVYSDSYDAGYYRLNNSAPQGSSLQQLFRYYITEGWQKGDVAIENTPRPEEVLDGLDLSNYALLGGTFEFNDTLSSEDDPNPDRLGSYAQSFSLSGLEIGQQVTLNLTGQFDTYLQLVDDITGEVLAENDNISPTNLNSTLTFTVQDGVNYLLRVTSVDANNLGDYTLATTLSPTYVGTLGGSATVTGTLSNSDPANSTREGTFRQDRLLNLTNVAIGGAVTVTLNSTAFEPFLQLLDATTGEVLAEESNTGNQAQINFVREANVTYIVRVTSSSLAQTGGYSLSTSSGSAILGIDRSLVGEIANSATSDTYGLDLTGAIVGSQLRVNLSSNDFDTRLTVIPSVGDPLTNDDITNGTTNSEVVFTVAQDVTYQVKIERSSKATGQPGGSYEIQMNVAPNGGSGVTLKDDGLQTVLGSKTALARADVLQLFEQAQKDGSITATEKDDLATIVKAADILKLTESVKFLTDQVVKGITVGMNADQFNQALVGAYFLGTLAPLANYVGKGDTARGQSKEVLYTYEYKPIQGSLYGSAPKDGRDLGQPRIRDINQRGWGDCYYLAALGAIFDPSQREGQANQNSPTLQAMITENGKETYNGEEYETWTFRFFSNQNPYFVTVDRNVVVDPKTGSLPGAARGGRSGSGSLGDNGEAIWVPLAERAFAQFSEQTSGTSKGSGYTLIGSGGFPGESLQLITGKPTTGYSQWAKIKNLSYDSIDDLSYDQISQALTQGQFVTACFLGGLQPDFKRLIVDGHAYALTDAYKAESGEERIVLRNPWGVDVGRNMVPSGDPLDGFVDLSFSQFKANVGIVDIA